MPGQTRRSRTASENKSRPGPLALLIFLARQERVRDLAGQACLLAAIAAASVLLLVAADHVVVGGLSPAWRTAIRLAGAAGVLIATALSAVRTINRRICLAYIARRAERAGGIRHNALVNAVLIDATDAGAYARPAALEQAAAALEQAPQQLPLGPEAWRPVLLAAAVLAVWVAYAVLVPKSVATSLLRLLGADLPAPTATHIALIRPAEGDVVRANAPLELEFELTGAPAEDVALTIGCTTDELRTGTLIAPARRLRSPQGADRRVFALAPFQVSGDIAYRCVGGDAVLEGVIPVHPVPRLESLEIVLTPPAYTRRPAEAVAARDFSALVGSRMTFRLVANTPLKQAVFVFGAPPHESRTRLRVADDDSRAATLDHVLLASGVYHLEITDDGGLTTPTDAAGRITVRPDEPPRFLGIREVGSLSTEPFVQSIETGGEWPLIDAAVDDDVLVEQAWFAIQVGTAIERTPITISPGEAERVVLLSVDLNEMVGADVQTATAWFEAQDGRVLPDGREAPQTTASPAIDLTRSAPQATRKGPASPPDRRAPESQPTLDSDDVPSASRPVDDAPAHESAGDRDAAAGDNPSDARQPIDEAVDGFIRDHGQEAAEAERVRRAKSGDSSKSGRAPLQPPEQTRDGNESPGQPADGTAPDGQPPGEQGPAPSGDTAGPGSEGQTPPADQNEQEGQAPAGDGTAPSASGPLEAAPNGAAQSSENAPSDMEPAQDELGPEDHTGGLPGSSAAVSRPEGPSGAPGGGRDGDAVADLVDAAERGEGITADELVAAGWPQAKADAFIRDLTHLREQVRRAGGVEVLRRRIERAGAHDLEVRRGTQRRTGTVQLSPQQSWADRLRGIAPPAGERVPDDLRPLLEAYYRAVAEHATRQPAK